MSNKTRSHWNWSWILLAVLLCSTALSERTAKTADTIRNEKANEIRRYMNVSVDPCEDFYEYVCGNWNTHHGVQRESSMLNEMRSKVNRQVKDLLEENTTVGEVRVERMVKDFYESCIDIDTINERGIHPVIEFIAKFGGWPVLDRHWDPTQFHWLTVISNLRSEYGMDIIIGLEVLADLNDNLENRIYLGEPNQLPLLTKRMYVDPSTERYRQRYRNMISKRLQEKFLVEENEANKTATEIVNFEVELAKGIFDIKSNLNITKELQPINLYSLNQKYPTIDFQYYVSTSLQQEFHSYIGVYEISSDYIPNLVKLIGKTPPRILANYIMWSAVSYLKFTDETNLREREKLCATKTMNAFPKVVGAMYARRYSSPEAQHTIEFLRDAFKKVFEHALHHNQWIYDTTKQMAKYKLNKMRTELIAYNPRDIDSDYREMHTNRTEFVRNILGVMRVDQLNKRRKAGQKPPAPSSHKSQPLQATSVNAAYMTVENLLKIPLGLLQPPVYHDAYPYAVKFAQLGSAIAHEMIHGFDEIGRHFDLDNRKVNWWDRRSMEKYTNRTKCFDSQYSDYKREEHGGGATSGGGHHQNTELLMENIAEHGGVKIAFKSYLQWLRETDNLATLLQETLPIEFTNTQLFFISYGQTWCSSMSTDNRLIDMIVENHLPEKFRVNAPLSNFEEFAKEFNCPPGSGMNSPERCEIF